METSKEKAQRLLAEGRIVPDPAPASVFRVTGDHGSYITIVSAHVRTCTCPHGHYVEGSVPKKVKDCSHIRAAVEWMLAEADRASGADTRFDDYASAMLARKDAEAVEADRAFQRVGA